MITENPAYDSIRSIYGKKKLRITLELILSLPLQLFFDIFRFLNIIFIRLSKHNILFVVSNRNQTNNIKTYLPEIKENFDFIHIKKARSLQSFPLFLLILNGITQIVFSDKFKLKKISNLDVSDACYFKSSKYLAFFLKVIKPKYIIISREDITPFSELARAAQSLEIKLVVVEHGIFVRNYKSFETTNTTAHVFSSKQVENTRDPAAKRIIAAQNPISELHKKYSAMSTFKVRNEIMVADTYSIRTYLKSICDKALQSNKVCLRFHPGQRHGNIDGVRVSDDKLHDLKRAKLVVTGVSGFALEAAMCGLPTIIVDDQVEVWIKDLLRIFDEFQNVKILKYDEFISADLVKLDLDFLTTEQMNTIHEKFFYEESSITKYGAILGVV